MNRILYVVGPPHSGVTAIDLVLGEHRSVASLGDVGSSFHVFDGAERCTCGADPRDCVVWGGAFATLSAEDRLVVNAAGREVASERRLLPFLLSTAKAASYQAPFDRMFDALFAATGAEVLVDSSGTVSRAVAMLKASRHPVRVLELVTTAPRPPTGRHHLALRYDDLWRDPDWFFARLGELVDLDLGAIAELIREPRPLGERHVFRGDPMLRERPMVIDLHRFQESHTAPDANASWRHAALRLALRSSDHRMGEESGDEPGGASDRRFSARG